MVLINDKKFSCATCIKGHRSTSCTHTDRPLFEIKKKGRPVTQCEHCRSLRLTKQLHVKCECATKGGNGETKTPIKGPVPQQPVVSLDTTRKGVPGPVATYPNGFRDVHALHAAAGTLSALAHSVASPPPSAVKVTSLLNPCRCQSGGKCKCCQPIIPPTTHQIPDTTNPLHQHPASEPPPRSGDGTPDGSYRTRNSSTDNLAELFQSKALTLDNGLAAPIVAVDAVSTASRSAISVASHGHHYHPAHTSPHVHKTKLFSPYSLGVHSISKLGKSLDIIRRPFPSRLRSSETAEHFRPADTVSDGPIILPRIREGHGDKASDITLPSISFPTQQDLMLDGCTCSDSCRCPGCVVHNVPRLPVQNESKDGMDAKSGTPDIADCPDSCTSCFDCRGHVAISSGIESLDQLISIANTAIPRACSPSSLSRLLQTPSHMSDDDADLSEGFVESNGSTVDIPAFSNNEVPGVGTESSGPNLFVPSETTLSENLSTEEQMFGVRSVLDDVCCNGRCQCQPGECDCMADCCGCCNICNCGTSMSEEEAAIGIVQPDTVAELTMSCCAGDRSGHVVAAVSESAEHGQHKHQEMGITAIPRQDGHDTTRQLQSRAPSQLSGNEETGLRYVADSLPHSQNVSQYPALPTPVGKSGTAHRRPILPRPASVTNTTPRTLIQTASGVVHSLVLPTLIGRESSDDGTALLNTHDTYSPSRPNPLPSSALNDTPPIISTSADQADSRAMTEIATTTLFEQYASSHYTVSDTSGVSDDEFFGLPDSSLSQTQTMDLSAWQSASAKDDIGASSNHLAELSFGADPVLSENDSAQQSLGDPFDPNLDAKFMDDFDPTLFAQSLLNMSPRSVDAILQQYLAQMPGPSDPLSTTPPSSDEEDAASRPYIEP